MLPRLVHRRIDLWLERLKWPVAFAAVLWTPLLCWAWVLLSNRVIAQPFTSLWFGTGFVLFFIVWKLFLKYRRIWRWLMRAEHEATHLLFAALTGHPIIGWRASDRPQSSDDLVNKPGNDLGNNSRGSKKTRNPPVHFVGEGNWLIQIAPYFFPTSAGILWLAALFIPLGFLGWTTIALGFATGFHVTSTILEIRADREELAQLGWRFCWMFLPAANLFLLGALLSFSQEGFSGIFHFMGDSWRPIQYAIGLIGSKSTGN